MFTPYLQAHCFTKDDGCNNNAQPSYDAHKCSKYSGLAVSTGPAVADLIPWMLVNTGGQI